jgi:hypothetical protein
MNLHAFERACCFLIPQIGLRFACTKHSSDTTLIIACTSSRLQSNAQHLAANARALYLQQVQPVASAYTRKYRSEPITNRGPGL